MYLKSSIQSSSIDYNIHITLNISSNIPFQYTKNIITNTWHLYIKIIKIIHLLCTTSTDKIIYKIWGTQRVYKVVLNHFPKGDYLLICLPLHTHHTVLHLQYFNTELNTMFQMKPPPPPPALSINQNQNQDQDQNQNQDQKYFIFKTFIALPVEVWCCSIMMVWLGLLLHRKAT